MGIGASAGGLEALEEFLKNMPADTGMAFVVVTHQHPGHTSLLPELLGKKTVMPVVEAVDGLQVEPNHVYVGPSGGQLAILNRTLHRMETGDETSPKLPIDYFFRSLAKDQQELAICVVLSGTGTDGTLGLKAIKAESGMAMVEQPQSAKYAGMPSSAIATGQADYVLAPAAMPQQLLSYAQGPYLQGAAVASELPTVSVEPMQKIFVLLRSRTSHDFSAYKPNTLRRRVERRMNVHQIVKPNEYVRYLQENPHEIDILFKEMLISVTSFFRDPDAWDALAVPIKQLMNSRADDYALRAWLPGCATGEEVFSLAITLRECMDQIKRYFDVQIFGTDLDCASHRDGPLGPVCRGHRRGCFAPEARPIFHPRRQHVLYPQGNPRDDRFRAAERDQRPTLHEARLARLPQSADLSQRGPAEEAAADLSLRIEAWRPAVSRFFRDDRLVYRSVRTAR